MVLFSLALGYIRFSAELLNACFLTDWLQGPFRKQTKWTLNPSLTQLEDFTS